MNTGVLKMNASSNRQPHHMLVSLAGIQAVQADAFDGRSLG